MLVALNEQDLPAWTWIRSEHWLVLDPATNGRPGGPVVFTSREHADIFAQHASLRGMSLVDAELRRVPGGLRGALLTWRRLFQGLGYAPERYCVIMVNPKSAFHPAQDWDGGAIPFDPELLPDGVMPLGLTAFDPLADPGA